MVYALLMEYSIIAQIKRIIKLIMISNGMETFWTQEKIIDVIIKMTLKMIETTCKLIVFLLSSSEKPNVPSNVASNANPHTIDSIVFSSWHLAKL